MLDDSARGGHGFGRRRLNVVLGAVTVHVALLYVLLGSHSRHSKDETDLPRRMLAVL